MGRLKLVLNVSFLEVRQRPLLARVRTSKKLDGCIGKAICAINPRAWNASCLHCAAACEQGQCGQGATAKQTRRSAIPGGANGNFKRGCGLTAAEAVALVASAL